MKPRVYIETTIPSFYHERRTSPDMVARREWTRQWWDFNRAAYELVTSEAVLDELERGAYPQKEEALNLMANLPLVSIDPAVVEVVTTYIQHTVMPADPAGDAMHLAIASLHKCDFLLTWNCQNLANANKFGHIRRINGMLGLFVPALITPLELLELEDAP
jgi:predicted nucleic acid-binding protein